MKLRTASKIAPALFVAVTLSACAGFTKQEVGTVAGGAVGAAAGSTIGGGSGRTAAMILGGLAGAVVGRSVGRNMDEDDRVRAAQAMEVTPTGSSQTWTNPDTNTAYAVTPTRTYTQDGGAPCREFTLNATVDGQPDQVNGTACRQADGSWRVIN